MLHRTLAINTCKKILFRAKVPPASHTVFNLAMYVHAHNSYTIITIFIRDNCFVLVDGLHKKFDSVLI